jgi:hypothetical protein
VPGSPIQQENRIPLPLHAQADLRTANGLYGPSFLNPLLTSLFAVLVCLWPRTSFPYRRGHPKKRIACGREEVNKV